MHDITDLERRGTPAIFVASDQFVDAAVVQSKQLGFSPQRAFIAHPIQDRTDAEVEALADGVIDALIAQLTS